MASSDAGARPPLGLARGTVVVAPYDARWPGWFEQAAAELRAAIGHDVVDILHVGSTSVPGLAAKPILDILVTVPDFERARELIPAVETLGYEFRPQEEIPDRHYFRRTIGAGVRTHHLSLAEPASRHARVTLAFRDALRRDTALAQEYAALKHALAARYPLDRESYINGKTAFVERVLASTGIVFGA